MSLPGLAPPRRSAAPAGTSPMIVTVSVSGPRVVSPPINETLYSWARSKKPLAKAASQSWVTFGSVTASVAQYGSAPIAAMSERFTASALCPRFSGSTSGKKCVPETIVSVETARSMPLVTSIRAASSPTPSTAFAAGRVKWRAMRSNSELSLSAIAFLPSLFRDLFGPDRRGQLVEDAVHVFVPVGPAEALSELDRLVDRDLVRDLGVVDQLPRADQQDGALHRAHLLPLAVGERLQVGAQALGLADRASQLRLEEVGVGGAVVLELG